jgi:hypothetical protein
VYFKVLSQHLPLETTENHEIPDFWTDILKFLLAATL